MKQLSILKPKEFSTIIEEFVKEKRCSYMDAVILYCEDQKFEIETAAKLLTPNLKAKLQEEAEDLNFLEKSARLPI